MQAINLIKKWCDTNNRKIKKAIIKAIAKKCANLTNLRKWTTLNTKSKLATCSWARTCELEIIIESCCRAVNESYKEIFSICFILSHDNHTLAHRLKSNDLCNNKSNYGRCSERLFCYLCCLYIMVEIHYSRNKFLKIWSYQI